MYGRVKHTYSIYRKMFAQNKTLDEIFDLYAFRVIVDDIPECYNVLGCIHDMFKPVLGRFKDYIGTPKPNMYQSLHTTVIGREGIPFEVQIRTWEMHQTAEYGIAAHWKYKRGMANKKLGSEVDFEWVRKLLESQQDTDAEEFVRTLKVDMFSDEGVCIYPQRGRQNLPAGEYPIDFAYNIHSAVGNSMVGARVNGRMVPYDTHLKNGDIVEVLTSKGGQGPQPGLAQDRQEQRGPEQDPPVVQAGAPGGERRHRPGSVRVGAEACQDPVELHHGGGCAAQHPAEGPLRHAGRAVCLYRLRRHHRREECGPHQGRTAPPGAAEGGKGCGLLPHDGREHHCSRHRRPGGRQPAQGLQQAHRFGHHRGGPGQLPGEICQVLHPCSR